MIGQGAVVEPGRQVRGERGQTFELAALLSSMGESLCALAERDLRRQHVLLRKEVVALQPELAPLLQPRCVPLGYCDLPANAGGRCRVRPYRPPPTSPAAAGHGAARETAAP